MGHFSGCTYLFVLGSKGSVNLFSDDNAKDGDGQGHIIVGIRNDSGSYFDLKGYTGPNNMFSGIQFTGGLDDGKSTYCEITYPHDDDHKKSVTPEPGSILLLGTGIIALGGILRRRLLL